MREKAHLRNPKEVLRDEMVERDRIRGALRSGPKTIPELAGELGALPSDVTKWLMGMRRYGLVRDVPKGRADDYSRYELVEGAKP